MTGRLITLLYMLMRDEVTPGVIEKLVRDAEATAKINGDFDTEHYSNRHLTAYAIELASRLDESQPVAQDSSPELGAPLMARLTAAIDILKAVVSKDRYTMITIENEYGRGANDTLGGRHVDFIAKGLTAMALDVLTGEQPIPQMVMVATR